MHSLLHTELARIAHSDRMTDASVARRRRESTADRAYVTPLVRELPPRPVR